MATLTGIGGTVTLQGLEGAPGSQFHVFEWTLDLQREVFDDTNFDSSGNVDENARTKVGGMYHGVGRVRATAAKDEAFDLADFQTSHAGPSTGNFVLTAATGRAYTFKGMIANINVAVAKRDRVFYDISFNTSGDVTAS